MIRRPPRSTRTDTLFPYTTLFRSHLYTYYTYSPQTRDAKLRADVVPLAADVSGRVDEVFASDNEEVRKGQVLFTIDKARLSNEVEQAAAAVATAAAQLHEIGRARVGKECVRTGRSRWSAYH